MEGQSSMQDEINPAVEQLTGSARERQYREACTTFDITFSIRARVHRKTLTAFRLGRRRDPPEDLPYDSPPAGFAEN